MNGNGYNQKIKYKWKCVKCGNEFEQAIYCTKHLSRTSILKRCPRCLNCYPKNPNSSALEINIRNYIQSIYSGTILPNYTELIHPKQVDIYLPEIHLAFEVDGDYWHSEKFRTKKYHDNKDKKCAKLGVTLIHITETNWNNDNELMKLMIKSLIDEFKK